VISVDVDEGELEYEASDSEVDFLEENEGEEIEEGEEGDDDEDVSDDDEEESDTEETPARKKIKLHIEPPEDYMSHAFYERGLFALSSIVAYKVKSKSPEYIDTSQKLPSNYPIWIEHYSSRGMSPPTAQLVGFVKLMDKHFHHIHGESILKDKGLIKLFTNHMQVIAPEIPKTIVSVFAKLRILVRVRALNKRNRNKKKEDAAREKQDKNSRQANVNRVWESSKR
jgi:hypothetical protein